MAKQILTHTARNVEDLISLLKVGGFACPTLPHYRYRPTQQARNALSKAGMIKQSGRCHTSISYVATDKFKQWQAEYESGETRSLPTKWAKDKKKNNPQPTLKGEKGMKKKRTFTAWMEFSGREPSIYVGRGDQWTKYGLYKTRKEAKWWGGEAKKVKITVLT